MKQFLRYTLLSVLCMVGIVSKAATTVSWSATNGSALGTAITVDENITLTWSEGSGDQAPRIQDNSYVYFYNGNQVKVTAANNAKITRIAFTFADEKTSLQILTGGGTYASGVWTGESAEVSFRAARQTGVRKITSVEITYTAEGEEVVTAPDLQILSATPSTTVKLEEGGYVFVQYKNAGSAAAENTKLQLYVNGELNNEVELGSVAIGQGQQSISYDVTSITAGTHPVYVALVADNNDAVQSEATDVTFTATAAQPTYSVTAQNVTVPFGSESFEIVATVKNTSEVNAEAGAEVVLMQGITVVDTKTTAALAAGAEAEVTFTLDENYMQAGGTTATYFVQVANQAQAEVTVTFEEEPVVEVKDLTVTTIQGSIDLANDSNTLTVWVQNNGNVNIENAEVTLTYGETTLTNTIALVKAGDEGNTAFTSFTIPSDGLEAGELDFTAAVEVEGDPTTTDNTFTRTITIEGVPAPEATYSITAQNVTVPFGAESFEIVATVKNTSEVNAEAGVDVVLMKGITTVETKQTPALAAGEEAEVTFTLDENYMQAGGTTATYFVQVANQAQAEVTVTFEEEPVVEVKDLTVTTIQGSIDLANDSNTLTVWVQNNGNVNIENAEVTLTYGETTLTNTIVLVKAGEEGNTAFCSFAVPSEGLEAGELDFTAAVEVEGDATPDDNTLTRTFTIEGVSAPQPTFTITANNVTVAWGSTTYNIVATVKNTSEVDATNVVVTLYKNAEELTFKKIATLNAGEEKNVTFAIDIEEYTFGTQHFTVMVEHQDVAEVTVSFEPEPVVEVVDLSIVEVSATLDADVETNYITVFIENKGNTKAEGVKITLTAGDTVLGEETVDVAAEGTAFKSIAIPAEMLEEGELEVTATIEYEGDSTPDDNSLTKTFSVITNGIEGINTQTSAKHGAYTIDGRKATTLDKGLYIINGRKVMMK